MTKNRETKKKLREISIHTPARGVTDSVSVQGGVYPISIHTPARGVTDRA